MIEFLDHQRAVFRTEANTVAKGDLYATFTRFVGNVVEITVRIRFIEVYSRRDLICVHRAQRRAEAGRATRALWMSDLRFGGRHRNARGLAIERAFQGARLDPIVQHSRSAVQVDVVDVLRLATRIFESESHCARRFVTVFSQTNAVIGIAGSAVTEDLGVNVRAAILRVPEFL